MDDITKDATPAISRPSTAEAEFAELNRTLSKEARAQYDTTETRDPEKILDDDDFDLLEYLSTTNSAASQAGIKRKRIGVVWENLETVGLGSMSLGVRTFPDAIVQNFSAPVFAILKVSSRQVCERDVRAARGSRYGLSHSTAPLSTAIRRVLLQPWSTQAASKLQRKSQTRSDDAGARPPWQWMLDVPQDHCQSTRRLPRRERRCHIRRSSR